ncbi:MAG TPA: BadF/BadG/BcrA/BcrD ATPase family protein [Candidatus Limnocylindrales bacterium]
MSALLLAVDGGNSKTDVVLLRRDGSVIGTHRGPTVSHQQVGLEEAGRRLRAQVDALRASVAPGADIDAAVLCLAGVDFPADERALARAHGRSGFGRLALENDTIAGLRAGSPTGWGVGVVVGAGINAVGVAPGGRRARFAGLGPLSGDRGGGEELGLEALGAAVRAGDRRGARTSLERLVPEHFGMRRAIDVTLAMYHGQVPERRLEELAAVAVRAARDGDPVALRLLADLAAECAAFATAAIRRLSMTRLEVPVVLSGGVARGAGDLLADGVQERVRLGARGAFVVVLHAPPVLGAALLALDLVAPGDEAAADRARAGITGARF